MARLGLLNFLALLSLSMVLPGCVSNNSQGFHASMVGNWENRSASLFGSGWDQCAFKSDFKFDCVNYPKEGSLVLPYEGAWYLVGDELQLNFDAEPMLVFTVLSIDEAAFHLKNKKGEKLTYEKVKSF